MTYLQTINLTPLADRQLAKNQVLFHQDDPVRHMFVIRRGKMRMVRHLIDGTQLTVHLASAGRLFAEASLFAPRYHCDAIAAEDCWLSVYQRTDLLEHFRLNPDAALAFMTDLAHEVQALRSKIELITIKSARERVLTYIQMGLLPGSDELVLAQSWKSVASEIGLSHEALYRALADLQKSNVIIRHGRRVRRLIP